MSLKNTGRRLTAKQKTAIAAAPESVTNTQLAAKFSTTLQTIAKYRSGYPYRRGKGRHGPRVQVTVDSHFLILKIPKRGLFKDIVGDLLS